MRNMHPHTHTHIHTYTLKSVQRHPIVIRLFLHTEQIANLVILAMCFYLLLLFCGVLDTAY